MVRYYIYIGLYIKHEGANSNTVKTGTTSFEAKQRHAKFVSARFDLIYWINVERVRLEKWFPKWYQSNPMHLYILYVSTCQILLKFAMKRDRSVIFHI